MTLLPAEGLFLFRESGAIGTVDVIGSFFEVSTNIWVEQKPSMSLSIMGSRMNEEEFLSLQL